MLSGFAVFIIFLVPIVFIHEYGHFFFARLCGVRVETFSIGFGPKILRKKFGETEYVLSLIPLGGYVKMFGDDPSQMDCVPEEDRKHSFTHKGKFQRFLIVVGGPVANFIMAFCIYFLLVLVGEKVPEIKFGHIKANHSFHTSGLRTGDVLQKINNIRISTVEDLGALSGEINTVSVLRKGDDVKVDGINQMSKEFIESFIGLSRYFRVPVLVNSKGVRFGISQNKVIDGSYSLEEILLDKPSVLYFQPAIKKENGKGYDFDATKSFEIEVDSENIQKSLIAEGFHPLDMVVSDVVDGSPAFKAKLEKGDILFTVQGESLHSFEALRAKIQSLAKNKQIAKVVTFRNGKKISLDLEPELKEQNGKSFYAIGVYSTVEIVERKLVESEGKGLFDSIGIATARTYESSMAVVNGFIQLITGKASMKNLGGPIAIAQQAKYSLEISLSYFFKLMAIISINLGILNLLPIPVLDGGHIMFIFFEVINRGPVPRKVMIIAQQIGLSLLLLLMFYAITNDFSRI
jgi:regulator of sigma E protease